MAAASELYHMIKKTFINNFIKLDAEILFVVLKTEM